MLKSREQLEEQEKKLVRIAEKAKGEYERNLERQELMDRQMVATGKYKRQQIFDHFSYEALLGIHGCVMREKQEAEETAKKQIEPKVAKDIARREALVKVRDAEAMIRDAMKVLVNSRVTYCPARKANRHFEEGFYKIRESFI